MSYVIYESIREFHEKFDLAYDGPYRMLSPDTRSFRDRFLMEELKEFNSSLALIEHELRLSPLSRDSGEIVTGLEGMIDALVDLVYVAMGTCYLQGLKPRDQSLMSLATEDPTTLIPSRGHIEILRNQLYRSAESFLLEGPQEILAKSRMTGLMISVAAIVMDFNLPFYMAWDRVHAANMRKVRATAEEQSKRGSKLDVIKPPGWEAPDHKDLVERFVIRDLRS